MEEAEEARGECDADDESVAAAAVKERNAEVGETGSDCGGGIGIGGGGMHLHGCCVVRSRRVRLRHHGNGGSCCTAENTTADALAVRQSMNLLLPMRLLLQRRLPLLPVRRWTRRRMSRRRGAWKSERSPPRLIQRAVHGRRSPVMTGGGGTPSTRREISDQPGQRRAFFGRAANTPGTPSI